MSEEYGPNTSVEECPACGGSIYTCLWCEFETPSSTVMDNHECQAAGAGTVTLIEPPAHFVPGDSRLAVDTGDVTAEPQPKWGLNR